MYSKLKRLDKWLDTHLVLLSGLLLMLILRIPNLFEPYWYGDEAIYLTVGNGLKHGLKLYSQIIDHKTPLIYYLAMVPSQLWFRVLNIIWMTVATIFFYHLAKRLLKSELGVIVATFGFILFTTLPWFEGNLPNGELFVIGFVLAGSYLLSLTQVFRRFFKLKTELKFDHDLSLLYAAGLMFGLAIMTKVPAVFDLVAFGAIFWFSFFGQLSWPLSLRQHKANLVVLPYIANRGLMLFCGALTPLIVSIVYFMFRGSAQAYFQFGLLYNFRYADFWDLGLSSRLLSWLFTFQGKLLVVAAIILMLTIAKTRFTPVFKFIASWLVLTLFASLLSNRPYPHYFLQAIPPLALLAGYLTQVIPKARLKPVAVFRNSELLLSGLLVLIFSSTLFLLKVGLYPTVRYYSSFYQLITGQISPEKYNQGFDQLMTDNYAAARIIKQAGTDSIFIWGTNPGLYALTGTIPSGRFTVSFHIKDFNAYAETIQAIQADQPEFIVVMRYETTPLPGLDSYLSNYYIVNSNFTYFKLWKRVYEKN